MDLFSSFDTHSAFVGSPDQTTPTMPSQAQSSSGDDLYDLLPLDLEHSGDTGRFYCVIA
ncbi:unnamed protein product [Somion occarium]|uniref:Pheromone n=1 Tax=Somion occarium TaxID=3059160 RepID=A0ABP1CPH5_9APHY